MTNGIGDVKGVTGTSMGHNTDRNAAGTKPTVTGNANPNDTKPPKAPEGPVPMPK